MIEVTTEEYITMLEAEVGRLSVENLRLRAVIGSTSDAISHDEAVDVSDQGQ